MTIEKNPTRHYTAAEWAREQYKGIWDDCPYFRSMVERGEIPADFIGRRTIMVGGIHGCTILTEGYPFYRRGGESMSAYPGIRYFFHDGGMYIVPHYTNASNLAMMFNQAREAAHRDMVEHGADHAVYGVKRYDPETGSLSEADIYAPAVLLDDDEFTKRTDAQAKEHPGSLILALHAMK